VAWLPLLTVMGNTLAINRADLEGGAAVDVRTDVPLYTVAEAARHLGLAPSTLRYWVSTKHLVRQLPPEARGAATLPFVALAEAQFIQGMRGAGLSLQAVTEGVAALKKRLGPDYLMRDRLAHDGRDVLVDLGRDDGSEWQRARDSQAGIAGVIELGLERITWADDGRPQRVTLAGYEGADVIVDPRFAFGQPMLEGRGVRVEDIAQLFFAGEPIQTVADEFEVAPSAVEAIVRAYARQRAA
jgi:uncharacterized protein (DUF433 family)/transposase-like protein